MCCFRWLLQAGETTTGAAFAGRIPHDLLVHLAGGAGSQAQHEGHSQGEDMHKGTSDL
jgi:hypothetical protein